MGNSISHHNLPDEVVHLIARCIDDVEQLEILLLLRGSGDRYQSADSIAETLFLERAGVASRLELLASRNLLDVRISDAVLYRFAPVPAETARHVDALAQSYAERRIAVLRAIGEHSNRAARAFADAFRIDSGKHKPRRK